MVWKFLTELKIQLLMTDQQFKDFLLKFRFLECKEAHLCNLPKASSWKLWVGSHLWCSWIILRAGSVLFTISSVPVTSKLAILWKKSWLSEHGEVGAVYLWEHFFPLCALHHEPVSLNFPAKHTCAFVLLSISAASAYVPSALSGPPVTSTLSDVHTLDFNN